MVIVVVSERGSNPGLLHDASISEMEFILSLSAVRCIPVTFFLQFTSSSSVEPLRF